MLAENKRQLGRKKKEWDARGNIPVVGPQWDADMDQAPSILQTEKA